MTEKSITPADLAEFKYRLPEGTKAPGQQVLRTNDQAVTLIEDGEDLHWIEGFAYWTRKPVWLTSPDLPTAFGSVITNICTTAGHKIPVALRIGGLSIPWAATDDQYSYWLKDTDIVSFDNVRVVPNGVGVLDEEDKSPVVDCDGDEWTWDSEREVWTDGLTYCGTKAALHEYADLIPASEKDES